MTEQQPQPVTPDHLIIVPTEDDGGAVVVHIIGEIDLCTAPTLLACLTARLESNPPTLVVDLSAVTFMAVVGLRALLDIQGHADEHGTEFRLAGCSRAVLRLLTLCGCHDRFRTYPTIPDALPTPGTTRSTGTGTSARRLRMAIRRLRTTISIHPSA